MTNQEYRKKEGISSSDFRLLEISPLHYANSDRFSLSGNSFDFGTLVHSLALEPEGVKDQYSISPKFDLRTKQGKADKKAYELENSNKIVINEDDYAVATRMAENVRIIAGGILRGGIAESSVFAKDCFGITRKCRPDYYIEDAGIVIDLKTTKSCKLYDFQKSIYDYKYHRQAAWYMDALALSGKTVNTFIIVAVEKSSPYMVRVFELDEKSIEKGREEYINLLAKYTKYLEDGSAEVLEKISLPNWAFEDDKENY